MWYMEIQNGVAGDLKLNHSNIFPWTAWLELYIFNGKESLNQIFEYFTQFVGESHKFMYVNNSPNKWNYKWSVDAWNEIPRHRPSFSFLSNQCTHRCNPFSTCELKFQFNTHFRFMCSSIMINNNLHVINNHDSLLFIYNTI